MKLSIIYPVLNSHEVVRRHCLYWEKIGIPDDVEIIIVDDGSDPPLTYEGSLPLRIIQTNDTRPWTWALARNRGAKEAKGKYILMTDIDHILTREAIDIAREFDGDKIYFVRRFGILTEDGEFTQDLKTLFKYGLSKKYYKRKGLRIGALPNNICLAKDIFWKIGGYREDRIGRKYPQGEDRFFKKAWKNHEKSLGRKANNTPAPIYMFPNGWFCGDVDYNPFGLFHDLSRATTKNKKHKEMHDVV
jgi:hypothetical protein